MTPSLSTAWPLALLAAAAMATPGVSPAQEVVLRASGARTLVGVVTDTGGAVVDSAEIVISALKRRTVAGSDGQFRFNDVKPGKYAVSARHIGYFPQVQEVAVGDAGGTVRFELVRLTRVLPLIVKTASRGGLSGIIGDTAYNTLAGVQVYSVVAQSVRALTDSAGRFFLDLRPGRHMIRIRKPGFGSRMMTVSIPHDSGREILVNLAPATRGSTAREEVAMQGFRDRMLMRSPVYSTFWTREDLTKMNFKELSSLVNGAAGHFVDESCSAIINGDGTHQLPIYTLKAAEVEALEVYAGSRTTRGARSALAASSGPNSRRVPRGPSGCAQVYVWLRK